MRPWRRIAFAVCVSLPAVLTGALALVALPGDYQRPIQLWACAAYLAASLALGLVLAPARGARALQGGLRCTLACAIAWCVALIVLGAISLTPLCVGQDNGDGINDLGLCVLQVIGVGVAMTPIQLALVAAATAGAVLLPAVRRRAQE